MPKDIFKSSLERKIAHILKEYLYEPVSAKVPYSIPHQYHPDFVHPEQRDVLIEVKGYFINGSSDTQKYLSVIRDNPDKELVFIFSDPTKRAYPQCRRRKDGSYLTLGEWCRKNNILFFTPDTLPSELIHGRMTVEGLRSFKSIIYEGE